MRHLQPTSGITDIVQWRSGCTCHAQTDSHIRQGTSLSATHRFTWGVHHTDCVVLEQHLFVTYTADLNALLVSYDSSYTFAPAALIRAVPSWLRVSTLSRRGHRPVCFDTAASLMHPQSPSCQCWQRRYNIVRDRQTSPFASSGVEMLGHEHVVQRSFGCDLITGTSTDSGPEMRIPARETYHSVIRRLTQLWMVVPTPK